MEGNLVIIGLNYEYNLQIGKLISDNTDLYFLDAEEFINYNLMSRKNMAEVCGIEYLEKQEQGVIKSCADFENSVICMPYTYFFKNDMYKNFNNSIIVYLKISQNKLEKTCLSSTQNRTLPVDLIVYEDRDAELKNVCHYQLKVANKKNETVVKEILEWLGGYCEK